MPVEADEDARKAGDSHRSDPVSPLHAFALRVLVVLALIALALFLWRIVNVLLLVFAAGLLAIVLHAVADPIRRRTGLKASAALGAAVIGFLVLLGAVFWLAGAELSAQATDLFARLPDAWAPARRWLQQSELGRLALQHLEKWAADFPLAAAIPRWMAQASGAVLGAVLVAFAGVYLAADPCRYRSGLLMLFPPAARERVGGTVDAATHALRRWLLAQLVVMAVVGTLTGLGMWLIGMPSPLALGVLAGLLEFVPYIGPIAAAVPGLLLALTMEPLTPLYALAVYLVVQQIECNVLTPLMARKMLALPPAFVVFSVVALGTILGPLGWIFAVPLAVVLTVAVERLYVRETLGTPVEVPGEDRPGEREHPDSDAAGADR